MVILGVVMLRAAVAGFAMVVVVLTRVTVVAVVMLVLVGMTVVAVMMLMLVRVAVVAMVVFVLTRVAVLAMVMVVEGLVVLGAGRRPGGPGNGEQAAGHDRDGGQGRREGTEGLFHCWSFAEVTESLRSLAERPAAGFRKSRPVASKGVRLSLLRRRPWHHERTDCHRDTHMSTQPAFEPVCTRIHGPVAVRIVPRSRDLGGFSVRRMLPSSERQMVGPFIFFDEMGPAVFPPGEGIDIRPHPHIGIATITYLFDGEIVHRDSLGYALPIRPGAVNLMTAGRGIVHSERAGSDRDVESSMHGIQSWIALPDGLEEIEPAFTHTPAADLPEVSVDGATVRLILGESFGAASPVRSYSKTLYAEVLLPAGGRFALPDDLTDRAVYVVSGNVAVGDEEYGTGVMAVFRTGAPVELEAAADTRLMLIGGEPVGERSIWWNFVSSSEARIEQAKADWREGRFDRVDGDDEFIPLPDQP